MDLRRSILFLYHNKEKESYRTRKVFQIKEEMHSEEAKRQAVNEENYKQVKKDQTKEH